MMKFSTKGRLDSIQKLDRDTGYGKNVVPFHTQFMNANAINIGLSAKIYRIMQLDRLKQVLRDKKLALVRPEKWDDPFENYILNAIGVLPDGRRVGLQLLREQHYAQCWTLSPDCDGLWRKFNKANVAIKVSSTVKLIFEQLYDLSNEYHSLSYFVGKVDYVPQNEIEDVFKRRLNLLSMGGSDLPFVLALLTKREQFKYENEVRFIFVRPSRDDIDLTKICNPWDDSDYFNFKIDPNHVFGEIEVEPWITKSDFVAVESELRQLGYTRSIVRSTTYDKPLFEIKL